MTNWGEREGLSAKIWVRDGEMGRGAMGMDFMVLEEHHITFEGI